MTPTATRPRPSSLPRVGTRPGIMDWPSGETLALIMLAVFIIAAIVLTRRG
jgi:hypothetical protein